MPGGSDSACFDNGLELLMRAGRSLPHAMMMMIPEAFGAKYHISTDKRAFYEYHSSIMEPWDGPAAMVFTDGRLIGGVLDRNGLRPCRYLVTTDGLAIIGSEAGVVEFPPEKIRIKGRLRPGRMFLVDTAEGRIISDNEIKSKIVRQKPYRRWLDENRIELRGLFDAPKLVKSDPLTIARRMRAFGYTREELRMILTPMAVNGQEPVGSMGNDTPLAVLSEKPKLLFNYFKQLFAQVTNPAIDPLREGLVMSLMVFTGKQGEPARRDAAALPAAQAAAPDPDERGHGAAAGRPAGRFPRGHGAGPVRVSRASARLDEARMPATARARCPRHESGRGVASWPGYADRLRGEGHPGGGLAGHHQRPRRVRDQGADPVAPGDRGGAPRHAQQGPAA